MSYDNLTQTKGNFSRNFSQKWTDEFVFLSWRLRNTWISISSFKYFRVIRIEKQIRPFVFWEKLRLDNFVSRMYWPLEIHENFKFLPVLNNTNTNFVTVFFKPLIHRRPFLASFLHDFHTLISWVTLLSWLLYCKKKRQFGGKVEWCTSYLPMGGKDQIIVPIPYCLQRKSECTYILTPHVYGSFINYVDMAWYFVTKIVLTYCEKKLF